MTGISTFISQFMTPNKVVSQTPSPSGSEPENQPENTDSHHLARPDYAQGLMPKSPYGQLPISPKPTQLRLGSPLNSNASKPALQQAGIVDLHKEPLHLGMQGAAIKRFQDGLGQFLPLDSSGTFDDKTALAVRQFQKDNKLPETGTVDAKTYGQLWNKSFWEKGKPLDLNGPEGLQGAPKNAELQAHRSENRVDVVDADSGKVFKSFPISAGSPSHPTPTYKDSSIKAITEKPSWHPPHSPWAKGAKPIGPGPNNPMGPVKLNISESIYFHGVPRSEWGSIGNAAQSHGCMRMYPQDAWELHNLVHSGTKVNVD